MVFLFCMPGCAERRQREIQRFRLSTSRHDIGLRATWLWSTVRYLCVFWAVLFGFLRILHTCSFLSFLRGLGKVFTSGYTIGVYRRLVLLLTFVLPFWLLADTLGNLTATAPYDHFVGGSGSRYQPLLAHGQPAGFSYN